MYMQSDRALHDDSGEQKFGIIVNLDRYRQSRITVEHLVGMALVAQGHPVPDTLRGGNSRLVGSLERAVIRGNHLL